AQRVGGGVVCRSSVAGGVGGLDRRVQGCVERGVFHVDAVGLRALRPATVRRRLCFGRGGVCPGVVEQEHTGDDAVFAAVAGLVAVAANGDRTILGTVERESATDPVVGGIVHRDVSGPGKVAGVRASAVSRTAG